MQTRTIILVVLALIVSLGCAWFQYHKVKTSLRLRIILALLRFFMLFAGFLLLINPEFIDSTYTTQKANLLLVVDESASISENESAYQAKNVLTAIQENDKVNEKYAIQTYTFAKSLKALDSLSFDGSATDINNALQGLKETYTNTKNRLVLISDGIQTYGADYSFFNFGNQSKLDAVVVGDTTSFQDVGIGLVNSNRYGFLNNQFPLEVQLFYSGKSNTTSEVNIYLEDRRVFREKVNFTDQKRSHIVKTNLKAQSVGIKTIRISLSTIPNEKNLNNNTKDIAVEIIDERTVVGIVSSIQHPDIAAIKKSVESNEQRQIVLLSPGVEREKLENVDVLIVYQPDTSFDSVFEYLESSKMGSFVITGEQTDWNFLNDNIKTLSFESFGETEEILSVKNDAFTLFDISKWDTKLFPPLKGTLGEIQFVSQPNVIAHQQIRGAKLDAPLFFVTEEGQKKQAFLMGENIWKWRLNTYRNNSSFTTFDDFMAKLIFYLSSSGKKDRLQLEYKNVFENATEAEIRATVYDNAFELKRNADLNLRVTGEAGFQREIPMLFTGQQYTANLSDFPVGTYTFTVEEKEAKISRSGQFKILDFDLEKQYARANDDQLQSLVERNSGRLFYPEQYNLLIESLVTDEGFVPVQKSLNKVVSLIDFKIVLGLMVLTLAIEWFIRKYNGLL